MGILQGRMNMRFAGLMAIFPEARYCASFFLERLFMIFHDRKPTRGKNTSQDCSNCFLVRLQCLLVRVARREGIAQPLVTRLRNRALSIGHLDL